MVAAEMVAVEMVAAEMVAAEEKEAYEMPAAGVKARRTEDTGADWRGPFPR